MMGGHVPVGPTLSKVCGMTNKREERNWGRSPRTMSVTWCGTAWAVGLLLAAVPAWAGPGADLCEEAVVIEGPGPFAFNNATASQDGPEHIDCSFFQQAQIDQDVWFAWFAPVTPCPLGFVLSTCGQTTVDTKLAVYAGATCPPAPPLGCSDDNCGPSPFRQTRVLFHANPDDVFLIRIGTFPGEPGGTGTFTITCSSLPANDNCAAAQTIVDEGFFPFDNTLASTDGPQHARCADGRQPGTDHDVWFCWQAPCNGRVYVSTDGQTNVDTKLFVYDGCDCFLGEGDVVGCSDDFDPNVAGNRSSHTSFEVTLLHEYLIRIGTFVDTNGGVGTFSLSCGLAECPASGSCTSSHFNAGCSNKSCCEAVCAEDPFCCGGQNGQWDSRCAVCASGVCNGNYSTCAPTAGLCSTNHAGAGCSDNGCCNEVCDVDPFCCLVKWDQFCAEKAAGLCNPNGFASCQGGAPDCDDPFRVTTPGCNDVSCCNSVCQKDTTCCVPSGGWDRVCELEAAGSCHLACGVGAGDCFTGHSGAGCNTDTCCADVCAMDPFCCLFDWDGVCAERAAALCSRPCDPGTVLFVDPPTGVVDAGLPVDPFGGATLGISMFNVTAPSGGGANCWGLCETQSAGSPNSIVTVDETPLGGGQSSYLIALGRPITPSAATTLTYTADNNAATTGEFIAHAGNVSGDANANAADVQTLIDCCLNQTCVPVWGDFSCDVDRSGSVTPADLMGAIDALNGAGLLDPTDNTVRPSAAGVCPPQP